MAYIFQTMFGAALAERLAPWMTDDLALYCDAIGTMFDPVYTLAYQQGVDGDADYVPGYGALFDVDLCPSIGLGFLASIVGVTLPQGVGDDRARQLIRAASGKNRGTRSAAESAIEASISTIWAPSTAYLAGVLVTYDDGTGTGPVFYKVTTGFTSGTSFDATNMAVIDPKTQYQFLERTNAGGTEDAYTTTVIVRPEQLTPVGDGTAVLAAINAVKPGGILINLSITDSPRWADATKLYSAVTGTIQYSVVASCDV